MTTTADNSPADALKSLPADPAALTEPYIFLSEKQADVILSGSYTGSKLKAELEKYVPILPAWIPQARIAAALGFGSAGSVKAVEFLGSVYIWATEFENVHTVWSGYSEPEIEVSGERFSCSEVYYHAQKPVPFDDAAWSQRKIDVMRQAVRAKYQADLQTLRPLLLSTGKYKLLAVKRDSFWGFDPVRGGENMLARLWEAIRDEEMTNDSTRQSKGSSTSSCCSTDS